ncbi:Aspartic protease 4 [Clonorchis sinensis]|uniref:Aspartic protease 4 n=1 Tax=Clonorchis sinensis TaxID=79923 RepID=A0A419Q9L1_CLOSI|nr:Aspartic protease 4 [Clonorchis sinensis]
MKSVLGKNILHKGYAVGTLQIGAQHFTIMFDTAGFSRWLVSTASPAGCYKRKLRYDINSATRISLGRTHASGYLDGIQRGNLVTDNLVLGDCVIPGFLFAEILESTCRVMAGEYFDGIFGMRRSLPGAERSSFPESFIDYAARYGVARERLFTFRLCGQTGIRGLSWFEQGELTLGRIKSEYHQGPITYVAISGGRQWHIIINKMEYGGQILCELCTAVVDTGAPTTIVPLGKVQLLLQNPELKDNQQGVLYVEPQDVPLVKDFKITFGQRVFTIPPKEMLLSKPTYSVYGLGYIVNYQRLEWTVGLSILRSFHTIFDDRLGQIGFSTVKC